MLLNHGVGEDSESPLDWKEIQPVHPKGDQSWIFIGRTDAEAEATILWPPGVKSWLIGKVPDAGKDAGKKRRRWQRMRCLNGFTDLMDMSLSRLQGLVMSREAWHSAVHGVTKNWTWLSYWTEQTAVIPKENDTLGHFGMAGVTTVLLVESPRFVACSTWLPLIVYGLGLPCVVWLSCFSV